VKTMEIDTETALTRSKRKEGGELHSIAIFTFRFVIVAEISLQLIAQTCTYCEMRCRGEQAHFVPLSSNGNVLHVRTHHHHHGTNIALSFAGMFYCRWRGKVTGTNKETKAMEHWED